MTYLEEEQIAIWKFGQIAPVLNKTHGYSSDEEYYQSFLTRPLIHPLTGKNQLYSPKTIKYWVYLYRTHGLSSLYPGSRSDKGKSRVVPKEAEDRMREILTSSPRLAGTVLREKVIKEGCLSPSVSQSSVNRVIKRMNIAKEIPDSNQGKDRKAFEAAHANDMWQADTTFLRRLNGKKVCLMIIIDDASRVVVGWGIFYEDNAVNFLKVLKSAVSVYGKPSLLYTDNGSPYSNHYLDLICANLNISHAQAPVRDGAAKGYVKLWIM